MDSSHFFLLLLLLLYLLLLLLLSDSLLRCYFALPTLFMHFSFDCRCRCCCWLLIVVSAAMCVCVCVVYECACLPHWKVFFAKCLVHASAQICQKICYTKIAQVQSFNNWKVCILGALCTAKQPPPPCPRPSPVKYLERQTQNANQATDRHAQRVGREVGGGGSEGSAVLGCNVCFKCWSHDCQKELTKNKLVLNLCAWQQSVEKRHKKSSKK